MTKLEDLLDLDKLEALRLDKRIGVQVHPTLPLRIYNYTNRAQFAGEWTLEERVCRGLIVDDEDNVIARGPAKFFNFGQSGAPEVTMETLVNVSRKEDGSLGIGWFYEGEFGVATRGSFTSDQAVHATALLDEQDKAWLKTLSTKGLTRIWEIIYPDNHIVVHYGNRDELIPLGAVDNLTGIIEQRSLAVMADWKPIKFGDAIAMPIPDDEEGYVLDIFGTDDKISGHLKLKGDRYKELHAATFQLSERKIWEAMGRGEDMEKFVSDLPDEIMPWAQGVVNRLREEKNVLYREIGDAMGRVRFMLRSYDTEGHGFTDLTQVPRGVIARTITENFKHISGPLFSYLDNRIEAVEEWAHKKVRPEHKLFRVEDENAN